MRPTSQRYALCEQEREFAVKQFKHGKADVLVATDVAAKGLDFPDVQVTNPDYSILSATL